MDTASDRARGGGHAGATGVADATEAVGAPHAPGAPGLVEVVAALEREGYHVVRSVGSGGMGVVFEAVQPNTNQRVAVKVARSGSVAGLHDSALRQEIENMAALRHPNIARVYAAGVLHGPGVEGRVYLVLEYIEDARPLDEFVHGRRLSIAQRLRLFRDVCSAAEHALEHRLIHGDLKAANVLVGADGEAKLTDFGLAQRALAGRGAVLGGTASHMSPERRTAPQRSFDEAGEVYALGVTLCEMLVARAHAGAGGAEGEDWGRRLADRAPECAGRLSGIVSRATARDRDQRTPTVSHLRREVEHELRRFSPTRLVSRRWALARACGVVLAAALGAAGAMALGPTVDTSLRALNVRFWDMARSLEQASPAALTSVEHVRIVSLSDSTDIDALARDLALEGVSSANARSLRRMHGELQRRLARAGPRAVVWDIAFRNESEFDDDFAAGVRALRDANIGVVVTTGPWEFGEDGAPLQLSRTIWASGPLWGSLLLTRAENGMYFRPLAVQRDERVTLPSIVTAGYAAAVGGAAYFECRVIEPTAEVELRWFRAPPGRPDQRVYLDQRDRIAATVVLDGDEGTGDPAKSLICPTDRVATLKLDMAPASALREATVDYEGLLRASPEALSGLVHGRVLLIGDARTTTPSPDLLDGIEGRDRVPGVEIVASSLEAVLQRHAKWAPDQAGSTLWLSAVAAVGAGVALLWRRVIARRSAGRAGVVWALGAAALLMMAVGGALVAYVGFDLITSPVVLSFCAVLAFVVTSIVLMARRPWSIFTAPFEAGGFQGWGLQKEACDATVA